MIAWAQGWVPPRAGSRSCAADQRLLSALLASTCASPHRLCACTCTLRVFPTTQTSIKQINREQTTKAEQANCSLWDMIISLVHESLQQRKKRKRMISCIFPKHTSWIYWVRFVSIYMPTSRHHHLMFHCYWFLCLSPQTLLYKCFSKGRKGWNSGSARSHSSQSRFFSAAVSIGKKTNRKPSLTMLAHRTWGRPGLNSIPDRM